MRYLSIVSSQRVQVNVQMYGHAELIFNKQLNRFKYKISEDALRNLY